MEFDGFICILFVENLRKIEPTWRIRYFHERRPTHPYESPFSMITYTSSWGVLDQSRWRAHGELITNYYLQRVAAYFSIFGWNCSWNPNFQGYFWIFDREVKGIWDFKSSWIVLFWKVTSCNSVFFGTIRILLMWKQVAELKQPSIWAIDLEVGVVFMNVEFHWYLINNKALIIEKLYINDLIGLIFLFVDSVNKTGHCNSDGATVRYI